ncbi:MAG: agmatine deiminase family protein [Prevotella koreensis]|uniref:agmatine deiminase family protein n=1 Tax=Prevotella koreensis TaxID=2490854 RepID=UPI003FA0D44C
MNNDRAILPAEWEPQSGVMLTWPHEETDWQPYLEEITETYMQMAEAIARREKLLVVTPHAEEIKEKLSERLGKTEMRNVRVVELPTNDTWARDHGFITLRNADGCPILLDFCFNGWGEKFDAGHDNEINRSLMKIFGCEEKYENHLDFVLEGGSIESDGCGTIFTTTSCLLAPHRNQPMTREQIDLRLHEMLRADRIIWIEHGQLAGDDTDGHIDTIVRPCARDTILYIRCDDPSDEHYTDFKKMELQLQGLRTTEGKPYKLLPLPFPAPIYHDGERLPATYANFLIINGAVLVPTYGQPENDAKALETLQMAFPDREMIPIDSTIITRQHGSIHCCTMQFPKEMQF